MIPIAPTTFAAVATQTASAIGGRNELMEYQPFLGAWVPAYSGNRKRQFKRKQLAAAQFKHVKPTLSDKGNYVARRMFERPAAVPLTETERFAKLVAAYAAGPRQPTPGPFATGFGSRPKLRYAPGHPKHRTGVMRASRKVSTFHIVNTVVA